MWKIQPYFHLAQKGSIDIFHLCYLTWESRCIQCQLFSCHRWQCRRPPRKISFHLLNSESDVTFLIQVLLAWVAGSLLLMAERKDTAMKYSDHSRYSSRGWSGGYFKVWWEFCWQSTIFYTSPNSQGTRTSFSALAPCHPNPLLHHFLQSSVTWKSPRPEKWNDGPDNFFSSKSEMNGQLDMSWAVKILSVRAAVPRRAGG